MLEKRMDIERITVSLLCIFSGIILIYLAICGPLVLNILTYKTAETGIFQIMGQDLVNLFLLSSLLIGSGITLFLKKKIALFLIISHPLYLIYYVLSYTVGLEWSSPTLAGNSEKYTFYFLFILISAVITLLYALSIFPQTYKSSFKKKSLGVYSGFYILFLFLFSAMWLGEMSQVMNSGTTRAYEAVPTAFWLIRIFDLGFTIPLGFLSLYLLWTRPNETYAVQFLFYGFFLTMITAVNSMGWVMFFKQDPFFLLRDMSVFSGLWIIVFGGFIFVLRNYQQPAREN